MAFKTYKKAWMQQRKVYAKDRITVLGEVSSRATSIGAAKIAGSPCQFMDVNGKYSWVAK